MAIQKRQVQIMGSSFYPGASHHIATMRPGQQLRLVREPANRYDKNAIAVFIFNQQLGHLARGFVAEVAPLWDVDGGKSFKAWKSRDPRFAQSGVIVVQWETPDEPSGSTEGAPAKGAKPSS